MININAHTFCVVCIEDEKEYYDTVKQLIRYGYEEVSYRAYTSFVKFMEEYER
jgi:hypothetical protein